MAEQWMDDALEVMFPAGSKWMRRVGEALQRLHAKGYLVDPAQGVEDLVGREVMRFAGAMEVTLRKHDGEKGGWGDEERDWLLGRLKEETNELSKACKKLDALDANDTATFASLSALRRKVMREATDVGNFAMMIFDNECGWLSDKDKKRFIPVHEAETEEGEGDE